jgi:hypothetical protein
MFIAIERTKIMAAHVKTHRKASTSNQTTTQKAIPPFIVGNSVFEHGYHSGIDWYLLGDHPRTPPTWRQIVDFISENMLELDREGHLDEERLIDNTAFLVGWLLGKYEQQ